MKYARINGPIIKPKIPKINVPPIIPINTMTWDTWVFLETNLVLITLSTAETNTRL